MSQLLIFTDLDGTLLDHHTYSFAAARPALAEIKRRGFPLVLISSKTRAELRELHRQLALDAPFISENGAAVHWRENGEWHCHAFTTPRDALIKIVHGLRCEHKYHFTGFSDCSVSEIAEMTNLSLDQATLAGKREYTEPLLWQDTPERLQQFSSQLREHNLRAVQGGRFLSVMGKFDKCSAMHWLTERYRAQAPVTVVALGDSHNDEAMLQDADIAVIVKSARSDELTVTKPTTVIRTREAGPVGWQSAMEEILSHAYESA